MDRVIRVLDLFSGIGGITYGLESTGGFQTIAFCEIDPFCREVLAHHWPEVPVFDDVRALRCGEGDVDMIVGGFPCQPFSVAGKQRGVEDERHLWPEFARLVREVRPRWVLAENVPGIRTKAADEVVADLEAAGYACWPLVVGADDVGAPHRRKRVWFVAHRIGEGRGDERSGGLLDGERAASGHDADGRGERPVGSPTGPGLEGQRADAGEPQEPEPRDAGTRAIPDAEGERRAHEGYGGLAGSRLGCDGPRWPARPGEPQHEWEEPRLAYARRELRHPGRATGSDVSEGLRADADNQRRGAERGSSAGSLELQMGSTAHGLPERLARRANRESLKALGNSVVPQVVQAIGRAILAVERA